MVTTTWNPVDKSDGITLSNGNLTAQSNSDTPYRMVRATHGLWRIGKGYFELTVSPAFRDRVGHGVATIGELLSGKVGNSLAGWGFQPDGITYHGSFTNRGAAWTIPVNGIFMCAVDVGEGKIWFGGDGVWFGGGNPETGENPAYSDVFSAVYPAWSGYFTSNITTARFSASSLSYTPPSGFSAWDDIASVYQANHSIKALSFRNDVIDGGAYRIVGTVDELGVVGKYRVRLFDRQSARCIRETWSAPDGSYSFDWISYRDKGYFAVAFDHGDNPSTIPGAKDFITPVPM